ncbi:hypothetical protein [Synechococcus sp. MIT S1220]|uniref:hypothetical protein n=1 Tax=Synechococcus sp. MIT S1220 TaxID=3082549 RepID=UPI0039AFDAB4
MRENDSHRFKVWLSVGMGELDKSAVAKLMYDDKNSISTRKEAVRMVGWHLGLSA